LSITPIKNTAGIYFDFNPPIITNIAEVEYVSDLRILVSSDQLSRNQLEIYPNPTTGEVYLDHDEEILSARIFDLKGGLQISLDVESSFNLSGLDNGLYIFKIETKSGFYAARIVLLQD
jgi:hypothetical protein